MFSRSNHNKTAFNFEMETWTYFYMLTGAAAKRSNLRPNYLCPMLLAISPNASILLSMAYSH